MEIFGSKYKVLQIPIDYLAHFCQIFNKGHYLRQFIVTLIDTLYYTFILNISIILHLLIYLFFIIPLRSTYI